MFDFSAMTEAMKAMPDVVSTFNGIENTISGLLNEQRVTNVLLAKIVSVSEPAFSETQWLAWAQNHAAELFGRGGEE